MKINSMKTGYSKFVNYGMFTFFIDVNKDGVHLENNDIIKQASNFNCVEFIGTPCIQKDDLTKVVSKLFKLNPGIKVTIHSNGQNKPVGMIKFDILYIIHMQMKRINKPFSERIKQHIINWYNGMGGCFLFYVENINDFDEVVMIVQSLNIKKYQVYILLVNTDNKEIIMSAKKHNYNIIFKIDIEGDE